MDTDWQRATAITGVRPRTFDLDALDGSDGVVIASPTSLHSAHTKAALRTGAKILVEKPLALPGEDLDEILARGHDRVMVGYNLRLHEPVRRAVEIAQSGSLGDIVAMRVWFGSWLPDWRPNVDYRTSYSARAELGGGVLLDAIHELDEIVWLAGPDVQVDGAFVGRVGPLDIDVEDTVKAVLRAPDDVPIQLSLDYLSRVYQRGIEVTGTRATLQLDWARSEMSVADGSSVQRVSVETPLSASYELEARRFLAFIENGTPPPVDVCVGMESLRLAERILEAASIHRAHASAHVSGR
jgi:predicted dehydrogenase